MTKRALLIGINRYQQPGADLRGCVNDVDAMRSVLRDLYGFDERNIRVLADLDATKEAIQSGFEQLVEVAQPGDVLYAHYSGHGSNVPDTSGDEPDGRDEILCPTDLDWDEPLLDDWLRMLFDQTPVGVNLTVVMDCCHSGSNTRALEPPDSQQPRQRFLPCPADLRVIESGSELTGALGVVEPRGTSTVIDGDVTEVDIPEVLITGCRDNQTSADAYIDGRFCGALTHSIVHAIRQTEGRLTYRQLHAAAVATLAGSFEQVPQLEGRAAMFAREFLSPVVPATVQ
jgi:hypothetical protein